MKIDAQMDVDVVGVEEGDEVTLMLELAAPEAPTDKARPPATVQVVLDRSGSMSGDRLHAAKSALARLVDRLDPADRLGIVAFDHEVIVPVPCGQITDAAAAKRAIASIDARGSTNLSAGLLRGLQEARRVGGEAGATVLLLSDGHANDGETDPARLGGLAAGAREHGVTTTTIGVGVDYDEALLSELARGGQGNHVFAEASDGAANAVAGEVTGLLSKTVQAASLTIRPQASVDSVRVWNDLPGAAQDGTITLEVGDLWSAERRTLLLTFAVPARDTLGLAQIAELELRYVVLPEFREETVTLPVHVNVVPGDEAAGRVPNPKVRTELLFQQTQEAKRQASEALQRLDVDAARSTYSAAAARIDEACGGAPAPELAEEVRILRDLSDRLDVGDIRRAAKMSRAEVARKMRKRGRGDTRR